MIISVIWPLTTLLKPEQKQTRNKSTALVSASIKRFKIYGSIEEFQKDLDEWMEYYNNERTHQGQMCCGHTLIQTLMDSKPFWMEKFIN